MNVIYKAPDKIAEFIEIENTLEVLQEKVGGNIETVTFSTDACVVCNEEGRLLGLPYNCTLLGVKFCGPVLIVGKRKDEFTDLKIDCDEAKMLFQNLFRDRTVAELKRETQRRLLRYREKHGLGCYRAIADASDGKISENNIRDIYLGDAPIPIACWSALSEALDVVEEAENENP